ncbi:MAG: AraC family transcriptional regulator [Pseudomonadales bacterium]|nr:AraC family transcriptional regulator [Pseudomonadales bacterium]
MQLSSDRLKPTLHPAYARLICAYFVRQGIEIDEVLESTNLDWESLSIDANFISFEQFSRLAKRSIELTAKPWVGFDIGLAIQTGHHGSLGYGAVVSPSVNEAVSFVVHYMSTRQRIFEARYQTTPYGMEAKLELTISLDDDLEFVTCAILGLVFRMAVTITGHRLENARIRFPYPEPEWVDEYHKLIPNNEFEFSCSNISLEIPKEYLDLVCLTHEASAFQMAKSECERIKTSQERGNDILQQVRTRLLDQHQEFMSLEEMATTLSMSPRTLMRKLKEEGSSYQDVLDDVRKEYAIWYLTKTDMTIDEVCESLGYMDASNFSRTFKRWIGTTPSLFRKTYKEQ